jgi:hypothetical protein
MSGKDALDALAYEVGEGYDKHWATKDPSEFRKFVAEIILDTNREVIVNGAVMALDDEGNLTKKEVI